MTLWWLSAVSGMAVALLVPFAALADTGAASTGTGRGVGNTAVFIVAGQSNNGCSSTASAVPLEPSPTSFTSYFSNGTSGDLEDNVTSCGAPGYSSAWPTLANTWQANVGEPIRLIRLAVGATCLAADPLDNGCTWDDLGTDPEPRWGPAAGTSYANMLTRVAALGPGSSLRAVLWVQGECESASDCDLTPNGRGDIDGDYQAALEDFADNIQSDFGVPVIASPISDYSGLPGGVCVPTGAPSAGRVEVHDGIVDAIAAAGLPIRRTDGCSSIYLQ